MILILSFLGLFGAYNSSEVNLDFIRNNYELAANNKQLCKKLLDHTEFRTGTALYQGYYGAFQAMYAGHAQNSSEKLKLFRAGKKNIEQAVVSDPKNVELRFIRLSIQKKAPQFLGYDDNIAEDKKFIKEHLSSITSSKVVAMCNQLIK